MHTTSLLAAAFVAASSLASAEPARPRIYFPRNVKRQFTNGTITTADPITSQSPPPLIPASTTRRDLLDDKLSTLTDLPTGTKPESSSDVVVIVSSTVVVVPSSDAPASAPASTPVASSDAPVTTPAPTASGILLGPGGIVETTSLDPLAGLTSTLSSIVSEATTAPAPPNATEPTAEPTVPPTTSAEPTFTLPLPEPTLDSSLTSIFEPTTAGPTTAEPTTPPPSSTPEPVTSTPEPVTSTPEPVTSTPEPVTSATETSDNATLPTSVPPLPLPSSETTTTAQPTETTATPQPSDTTATPGPTETSVPPPPPPSTNSSTPAVPTTTEPTTVDPPTTAPSTGGTAPTALPTASSATETSAPPETRPTIVPGITNSTEPAVAPTAAPSTTSAPWLPTTLVIGGSSAAPPSSDIATATTAVALPPGLPNAITPDSDNKPLPDDAVEIQIGFRYALNYEFVAANPKAAAQIFKLLPRALSYLPGTEDVGKVQMRRLQPLNTQKDLGYLTTLAFATYPRDQVNRLRLDVKIPSSKLYQNVDMLIYNLTLEINPSIDILGGTLDPTGGGSSAGDSPNSPGGAPNDVFNNENSNNNPSTSQRVVFAGITLGAVSLAAAYGAAMFLIARRYKKKKQAHQRSSSLSGSRSPYSDGMRETGSPALMGGALLSREFTPSPYGGVSGGAPGGRDSHGSGRSGAGNSGRTAYISAPVAQENSLGWN